MNGGESTIRDAPFAARMLEPVWGRVDPKRLTITCPGEGNMNTVVRVGHGDASFILKQAHRYVRKFPSIAAPIERLTSEVGFYQAVSADVVVSMMPRLIHHHPEHDVVVMEDLGHLPDRSDVYRNVKTFPLRAAGDFLHRLHAIFPDPSFADLRCGELARLNAAHMFNIPIESPPAFDASTVGSELDDAACRVRGDDRVRERLRELRRWYLDPDPGDGCRLCHGDFYPGSWLGDDDRFRVIDPEFAFVGPAEFDVAVAAGHHRLCLGSASLADSVERMTEAYGHPVDRTATLSMAAAEVLRRLIGVAQLPLTIDSAERAERLFEAAEVLAA